MATPPSSILIIGSGVFGLGTAYALTQRKQYQNSKITLLERLPFPAPDGSSIDSSRIVRADYADPAYTLLMQETYPYWRSTLFGEAGRYTEAGLCIVMDDDYDLGRRYMNASLENVEAKLGLKRGRRGEGGQVEVLGDEGAVKRVMRNMGGEVGKQGYVNCTSGWSHAEDGVRYLRSLVEATGRVDFQTKEVSRLLFSPDHSSVLGIQTTTSEEITADLTILATGAWTPSLLDLRGIASANGQIMAYLNLTAEEQEALGSNPTLLNESSGMFIIPPRDRVLKVARHGYGYANPVTIPHPEKPANSGETITVSLPYTKTANDPTHSIPPEGLTALRAFLAKTIPSLASRPFTHTRICWYTDTPASDWLITHHPTYKGLFLATGGSGHGYKFLPIIGERIVDVLEGKDRDELGRVLREKWQWPRERVRGGVGNCGDGKGGEGHVWTDDWRGGRKGMVLAEEMGWSGNEGEASWAKL